MDDYLSYLDIEDAATEWRPLTALRSVPLRAGQPRLDPAANEEWMAAWRRGLVSDADMAWYTRLFNRQLRGDLAEWLRE